MANIVRKRENIYIYQYLNQLGHSWPTSCCLANFDVGQLPLAKSLISSMLAMLAILRMLAKLTIRLIVIAGLADYREFPDPLAVKAALRLVGPDA